MAERPLVDPQRRFVVLFSAKSACSTVVIWFLHQIGLAEAARRHSGWPHHYRQQCFYERADYRAARETLRPGQAAVLRVVRDPVERAASSFRHALGLGYAREPIQRSLGIDTERVGLSFEQFIDFLETEDLARCDPHHRRQRHPLERLRPADTVINASRQDLFDGLNAFERGLGLPHTDFASLAWIHELQAGRAAHSVDWPQDPYTSVLQPDQARQGPWPRGLLTAPARARLERLYADDLSFYGAYDG